MGESNYHDSCMVAYRQDVRKLEEKIDGFKLHHILQQNNKAADALARLGSSHEPPPLGVFTHDLFKPSIHLEEDCLVPTLGAPPGKDIATPTSGTPSGEDSPTPAPRTLPGEGGPVPTLEASPGTLAGELGLDREPGAEMTAITGLPSPNTDRWEPISEYLQLRIMSDDENKTWHLARRAKGYLIHNDELYRRNSSGILQWCIPGEEGKALLLNIHKGICGHHASSRSMVRKAFQ
jgi:hypothetical protein